MRMQQKVQVKESRWMEATPKRWKQPQGEDRNEMKKESGVLRCTLLNGSDLFFWDRAQIEEGGDGGSSTEKPRKVGDLQLTQQGSPMKGQAVWTRSIRQEGFLWWSTETWEQSLVQKRERLNQSQATKDRPSMG